MRKNTAVLLKQARTKMGLTQTEIAKKCGFSIQFYGRCEKGDIALPKEYLGKVSDILKIRRAQLFSTIVRDFSNELGKWL